MGVQQAQAPMMMSNGGYMQVMGHGQHLQPMNMTMMQM